MEDAFAVRIEFKKMLGNCSSSQRVIKEITKYCLDRIDHSQDLFNCIMEHLGIAPVLERVNLLYVLGIYKHTAYLPSDNVLSRSFKNSKTEYTMLLADSNSLLAIAKLICPETDPSGDANAVNLKKVLNKWGSDKGCLPQSDTLDYKPIMQLISLRYIKL